MVTIIHETKEKIEIRRYLLTLIKDCSHIFTLPGSEWIFERMLLNKYKHISFACCENNIQIYETAVLNAPFMRAEFYNQDAIEYLLTSEGERFHFIWLDLCGSLSATRFTDIIEILKKKSLFFSFSDTHFAVTLSEMRLKDLDMFNMLFGCQNAKDVIKTLSEEISEQTDFNLIKDFEYESAGGIMMHTLVFKNHNNE